MNSGIPYFPLDVHLDDKFNLIEAEFGLKGFAVVVKLFQKIYGGHGYYGEWTKDVALVFCKSIGQGLSVVSQIVRASVSRGIFDRRLFEEYSILTSVGIQKRYFEAVSRRKKVDVKKAYLLVDVTHNYGNVNILEENVHILGENADNFKQSKEEESKEEKSKGEETPPPLLTGEEYEVLSGEFGQSKVDEYIKRVTDYCAETGKKYKNPALVIRRWILEDRDKALRPSRFNNYTDTNSIDFEAYNKQVLSEMLEGGEEDCG